MMNLVMAAVLQASLLGADATNVPATYAAAHQRNVETGEPLLVLVGADWCPACRQMKQSVMPAVARAGWLGKVAYAEVNTDREGQLARSLMSGGSIPQLVLYYNTADGWQRERVVGARSPSEIASMIRKATEATAVTRQASDR